MNQKISNFQFPISKKKKLFVILPAFNEEKVIGKVLVDLKKVLKGLKGFESEIVVVDDCSEDTTGKIAARKGATVLRHVINRGLGGALGTGLTYARQNQADFAVTMDSDGQHDPVDLRRVIKPLLKRQADVVIGRRDLKKMPWDRRVVTVLSSLVTLLLFGVWCQDTQSGFRALDKKALKKIKIKTQRMEVSSEFFHEIKKHKLRLVEVPIRVIYTPYSRSKGQSNVNAVKILLKLGLRIFR